MARGWGAGCWGKWGVTTAGCGVSFVGDENVLTLIVIAAQFREYTKNLCIGALSNKVTCMAHELYLIKTV